MTNAIEVEIYGQRYSIKGDADEAYVRKLAEYLDGHMREVARNMKTATPSKLAVLAAINIAHLLFQSDKLRETEEADVERRLVSLLDTIEEEAPASRYR